MPKRIGILFCDQENAFWQEHIRCYHQFLPEYPFSAEFFYTQPSRDADAQAVLCRKLMQSGFDALIANPFTSTVLHTAAQGITPDCTIFDVGPKSDPESVKSMKSCIPLPVCSFQEQGQLCMRAVLKDVPSASGPVALIGGPKEARQSRGRIEGAAEAARELGFSVLSVQWSTFTRKGGYEAMKKLLPDAPCAVFCANDLMALGALQALDGSGITLPVGGVDLIPEALEAVQSGRMAATVGPLGKDVVRGVLNCVRNFLERGELPNGYLTANTLVTGTHFSG